MNSESKELLHLLQTVRRHSKKESLAIMRGLSPEGQYSLLVELRRAFLELRGQRAMTFDAPAPEAHKKPLDEPVKAKKVPYSLLLPPSMLEGLKTLSERDGAPVSHHIRVAIRAYLTRAR